MVGGGQRLTAKATQPLSVIVWWRPDSDSGLLVLELQPRIGSIIFARDGVYLFVLFGFLLFFCLFFCFVFFGFFLYPLTMGTLSRYFVLWAFQGFKVCPCVCVHSVYTSCPTEGHWQSHGHLQWCLAAVVTA